MAPSNPTPDRPTRGQRIAGAILGGIFLGCGIACLFLADTGIIVACGLALGGLGVQALWASGQGRRSWLDRVGPLP